MLRERDDFGYELWYDEGRSDKMPVMTITDYTGRLKAIIETLPVDEYPPDDFPPPK